jgi:predicted dehydrogenase
VPSVRRRIIGANDRINLAAIGIRNRGAEVMQGFARIPNVCIKTVVDVDENLFADAIKKLAAVQETPAGTEYDLRRAFDDPEIDGVIITTPDHWHALATIWACQAGKHVYVEKPTAHNIWESRRMVEAARKYDRIVCVGMQNRSLRNVRQAMQFLHDGKLGDVYMVRALGFKPRESIGRFPDEPVPKGVHYDLWMGCAPERPFNRNRFHYNWHWHWDYGSGEIGNQGPHQCDIARWALKKNEHPVRISSSGGRFSFEDSDQETPNTQTAVWEYADGKMITYEVRNLYTNPEEGILVGNLFYGTKGWMHLNGTTWKTYFGRKNEPGPTSETAEAAADPMNLSGAGAEAHFANFIHALRSGRREDLTCDIETGHMSSALPLLANIAYRCGRTLTFDGAKERFPNDAEAGRLLGRRYRKPYLVPERV